MCADPCQIGRRYCCIIGVWPAKASGDSVVISQA
nr:MAG TPA: hypothetical protein [Caudoviricetes sp.]